MTQKRSSSPMMKKISSNWSPLTSNGKDFPFAGPYDGKQAWEMVNAEKPDLVILDLIDAGNTGHGRFVRGFGARKPPATCLSSC